MTVSNRRFKNWSNELRTLRNTGRQTTWFKAKWLLIATKKLEGTILVEMKARTIKILKCINSQCQILSPFPVFMVSKISQVPVLSGASILCLLMKKCSTWRMRRQTGFTRSWKKSLIDEDWWSKGRTGLVHRCWLMRIPSWNLIFKGLKQSETLAYQMINKNLVKKIQKSNQKKM